MSQQLQYKPQACAVVAYFAPASKVEAVSEADVHPSVCRLPLVRKGTI